MNNIVKFFGDIAMFVWCVWSNARFKQAERHSLFIADEDKIESFNGQL